MTKKVVSVLAVMVVSSVMLSACNKTPVVQEETPSTGNMEINVNTGNVEVTVVDENETNETTVVTGDTVELATGDTDVVVNETMTGETKEEVMTGESEVKVTEVEVKEVETTTGDVTTE